MNELIEKLSKEAWHQVDVSKIKGRHRAYTKIFAELIVKECIDKIETYRIPVGNSAAGEMACEYTYDALKEIRNEIKEHFGVEL